MSETDEASLEGAYIERDTLYNFLTDAEINLVLTRIAKGWGIDNIAMDDDIKQLFVDMRFVFEDNGRLELNEYHELTEVLRSPHIRRLLSDDVAIALLSMHLTKLYLPCIPTESFKKLTGFSEEEIEAGLDTLRDFRLVRGGMVMEGKEARVSEWDEAEDVLHRVDALDNLFEDQETVSVAEIEEAIGEIQTGGRDEEKILALSESEFMGRLQEAVAVGVDKVRTTDNLSTLEAGTHGTTLNESSDLANTFGRLQTSLLRHTREIQEYTLDDEEFETE